MKTKILPIISGIILILVLTVNLINMASAVSITNVLSTPSEIAPGQIADVSITIENILDCDIQNIRLKLDLAQSPFAPYQSSSERFLDELEEGDEEDLDFKLIVLPNTASGVYKIPIQLTYTEENQTNITKTDTISLIVNSKPELKVSLEDSVIIQGRENEVLIRIINSGLADVKFVYVVLEDINGLKILNENEKYIGDINSDDFDSVTYNIFVNEDEKTSKIISLPVTIKYKDATNKQFTETKIIKLKVYSLKEAQNLGLVKKQGYTTYIIIGIVIFGYIIHRIRKSIKKKRKLKGR